MVGYAEIEKLRSLRGPQGGVLSLYLPIAVDAAGARGLAARAGELMAAAGSADRDGEGAAVSGAEQEQVLAILAAHARDWKGRTAAIFACDDTGLLEAFALPSLLPVRAVLSDRPHLRPLLAVLQRSPDYFVVVADRHGAWVLSVTADGMRTVTSPPPGGQGGPGLRGWHGPGSRHVRYRAAQRDRHTYQDVAAALERAMAGDRRPLVIGGDPGSVERVLRSLPSATRAAFAGSFAASPQGLDPARVRELAGPVIGAWAARRERRLTGDVLSEAPGTRAAAGLSPCLVAVNAGAASLLLIPDEDVVPGFACGRCGALSVTGDDCPDWGTATRRLPDLLEEMTWRVLGYGGEVIAVRELPVSAAARLRFPVTEEGAER